MEGNALGEKDVKGRTIGLTLMAMMLILLMPTALAQSTGPTSGPDFNVQIVCDQDYYTPGPTGQFTAYCDITNLGGSTKNEKVGATFDDFNDIEVDFLDVSIWNGTDWVSIKPNMNQDKPQSKRTRQLSQQNIQTQAGQTTQVKLDIKVPLGSDGKFDVLYGSYDLDPWWNVTWQYKMCWNVSGQTRNLTGDDIGFPYGYPFNVTLNSQNLISDSKMNSDCSDMRLLINDSDYVHFFVRDCNQSVTEVWGAWNFTVGESYEACLYYGNPSAPSNMTDRYDIVFEWQDFDEDMYPFNWSEYYNVTASQSGSQPIANISNGLIQFVKTSSGNNGFGFVRNDTDFNITKTGLLVDSIYYGGNYYVGGTPAMVLPYNISKAILCQGVGCNYVACSDRNCIIFITASTSTTDWQMRAANATSYIGQTGYFAFAQNASNYESGTPWHRSVWSIPMPVNGTGYSHWTLTANYTGWPYTTEVIMNPNTGPNNYIRDFSYGGLDEAFNSSATLMWSSSIGGGGSPFGGYDFIFARPLLDGEPMATGGIEVPLDNGTLAIQFVSPTPVNETETTNLTAMINVSANKTIEWCKLNWNGVNYTMDTDTNSCYLTKILTGTPTYYDVFVEDYWGYQAVTPQMLVTGTDYSSLLGNAFPISDFNISSSSYETGLNVTFNSSLPTTSMILMTSMDVKKQTGNLSNDVYARVILDGTPIAEEVIRTVDELNDEGSTGLNPIAYNMSAGQHYIQIDFKRTGDGVVSIDDINVSMGQLVASNGGTVVGNIGNGSFTHNSTSFVQASDFNFTIPISSNVFVSYKIIVSADNATEVQYQFQNLDNTSQVSPIGAVYLEDADDVMSLSGGFIGYFPVGQTNMTVLARSSTGANVSVNFTSLDFQLLDNYTKEIDSFQVSNPSTDNVSSINVTDSWTLIDNATKTVQVGDSYFISYYGYYNSNSGSQVIYYKINATGTDCSSKSERDVEFNNETAFTYMNFVCDNLTTSSTYDFQVWAKASPGQSFDQYDDSFTGFEVNSFDITTGNLPPLPGVITNPVNGSEQATSVNVTWSPWTDTNGNFDYYNVSLLNADGSFNQTLVGSTTNVYYDLDISSLPSIVDFGIMVDGCDVFSLCVNETVFFTVMNPPDYSAFSGSPATTNFSAEPDLTNVSNPVLANSYGRIDWSGSGFVIAGVNFTRYVSIAYNSISVNSVALPTFNSPATVTLNGLTYNGVNSYKVLRDGALCTTCVKLSANPVSFTVPGFSNYTTSQITSIEQQPVLAFIPLIVIIGLLGYLGLSITSGVLDLRKVITIALLLIITVIMLGVIYVL